MKASVWVAFAALCVVSGSGWLLREWQPEALPAVPSMALHSGLLMLTFWAVGRSRGTVGGRLSSGLMVSTFGWMLLLAGLPTVVVAYAADHLSPLIETLVFAMVPAFVVLVSAQTEAGFGVRESSLALLVPALAGVAGAALLLPLHLPASGVGWLWLMTLVIVAAGSAGAAVGLHPRLAGVSIFPVAALFSASIFLLSAPLCFALQGQRSAWSRAAVMVASCHALLFDGPVTLLTVWLLREVKPTGFSARVPLVLAVTIFEGYCLLRPEMTWATGLGLLLLLCSGAWLLTSAVREVP